MSVTSLVENLKAAGEDFEFYPTTPEIIDCVLRHVCPDGDWEYIGYRSRSPKVVLDVGAGRGDFLRAFGAKMPRAELLAIERSLILMNELVKFAKVIGTDFHAQSFMGKKADIIFCNPPYSEFQTWAARLIRECPAQDIYLVIPQRWKDDPLVKDAIDFREASVTVLGSFDFEDGERRARAKVDVLHVFSEVSEDALFEKFFTERFAHLKVNMEAKAAQAQKEDAERRHGLVARNGLIGALVELYNARLDRLQRNYDRAASIEADVLVELGLSVGSIVGTLKEKLETLKNDYWSELFQNLDSVTKRLTTKNRNAILATIGGFKAVDFTTENISAVLLWVLENANKYTDQQVLDVFDQMIDAANIHNYKSNQRVYGEGSWRYGQRPENISHVSLDYRIVLERHCSGMVRDFSGTRLSGSGRNLISDILCVANLLGFANATDDERLTERDYGDSHLWRPGKPQLFSTLSGDDLLEVRAFLNGNLHIRMSQEFALSLNVAVGKLRGWLRDHSEARAEFGEAADAHFGRDLHIGPKQLLLSVPA